MKKSSPPLALGRSYILLAFVILFWGVNWPIMKLGLQYIPPLWFAATRMLLGSICLFAFLAIQGQVIRPGRPELSILISVGVFQIGLPSALIHVGLLYAEAGHSAILVFTIPLWVAPMAVVVLGERMSLVKLAGLAAGLAGIALLLNPLNLDLGDRAMLVGNGFMLLASVSFAVAIIIVRRHDWTVPIIQLMPWQMLFGTGIIAAAAIVIEGDPAIQWSAPLVAVLAYNGPVASAFCFWAYVTVSRNLPAMNTALGSLGVPVIGVFASALILGESLSLIDISGLILISAGVLTVTIGGMRKTESP